MIRTFLYRFGGLLGDVQSVLDDALGALLAGKRNLPARLGQAVASTVGGQGAGIALRGGGEGGGGAERKDRGGRLDCWMGRDPSVTVFGRGGPVGGKVISRTSQGH